MTSIWEFWRGSLPASGEHYKQEIERLRAQAPVPALWLFGKTGSGKSSLVRYLTGAEAATVGEGFRPQTKTSRRFDFPDALEPLLTFVDTRGLGEAAYNPTADIEQFSQTLQLMLVTVRVGDHALQSVIEPLRRIRQATRQRPVLLVLTCLHEATTKVDLSAGPDPFASPADADADASTGGDALGELLPPELQALIDEKARQFEGLVDAIIPVDITKPEDGFANPNFGGQRLKQAILDYLPHAYRQALLTLNSSERPTETARQRRARWQVLASSALAGTV
ncbi:MAG: GTPase domain-containing protein, partial [Planctomycetales bacterium]|nr:GTPase domain-containing protein [Planctomycetales bacterium]